MDKKEAIFKSTLSLINQYGFHGTPMSQVAQQANVAIGTIYHYFSSKDELIFALYKYCKAELKNSVFEEDSANKDFKQRFFDIWLNIVEFYVQNPDYLGFLDQFYSSPYLQAAITNEIICGQDGVAVFLSEGVQKSYIRDLDISIISVAFIGTAVSAVKRQLHGVHQFDKKSLINIVEIIWEGIKK